MKKICLALFTTMLTSSVFSQTLPDYESIRLEQKSDYNTYADSAALVASNYILSLPVNTETLPKLRSLQYVLKWMTGTPAYNFNLGSQASKITSKNEDLLGVYLCAFTKAALEDRSKAADEHEVMVNSFKILMEYCKVASNNVKVKGELKKMMEAYEKGELNNYIH